MTAPPRLMEKQVEGGAVVETVYDERRLVVARMDGEEGVTRVDRDARGREVRVVDPLGRATTYERDARGDVVRVVDPAGGVHELHRDERGNVIHEADPTGAVTSTAYDGRGLVTSIVSPTGGVTQLQYDQDCNLVEQIEPTGARWRWTHDPLGREPLRGYHPGRGRVRAHSRRGRALSMHGDRRVANRYVAAATKALVLSLAKERPNN